MDFLKTLIDPERLFNTLGDYSFYALIAIIFSETGLMIGFFLPGDSLLFLAGMFTANGYINPAGLTPMNALILLLFALTVSAIVGDQTGYIIGRRMGKTLFDAQKRPKFIKQQYLDRTKEYYDKHGGKAIILGRFIPVIRTFVPMIAGVVHLPYKRFVVFNVIGGIVWIFSMTLLGYTIGNLFKPYVKFITLAIILISFIPVFQMVWQEYRKKK